MNQYHKINSLYKRDEKDNMLWGQYSDPEVEYLKDCKWLFTEKVDGTNIRIMFTRTKNVNPKHDVGTIVCHPDLSSITFGGKTDNAQIPATLVNKLKLHFPNTLSFEQKFGDAEVCLYGEGYGAGIQNGGKYIPNGVDFILFDVKIGNLWLQREDVEDIGDFFGIEVAPIIDCISTIAEAEAYVSKGFKSMLDQPRLNATMCIAEGVIGIPFVPLQKRNGQRIITKIKHKDYQGE